MRFGFSPLNMGVLAVDPEAAAATARHIEEVGGHSIWVGEHPVFPSPCLPPARQPDLPILDPLIALARLSGATRTACLGTSVVLLPLHHPVTYAKSVASLDVVSGGRVRLGVGTGYLRAQYRSLGIPYADRSARLNEHIDAMRALWTSPSPRFDGRFTSFACVDAHPRPCRPNGPPILVGGRSDGALRRAVSRGDAWMPSGIASADRLAPYRERLRRLAQAVDRPAALGDLATIVWNPGTLDADALRRFAAVGVEEVVAVLPFRRPPAAIRQFVEQTAELFARVD